jgi:hypothetical protein
MPSITRSSQEIPVVAEKDVLILGGGPSGICAAVAAARNGADVGLVERYGHMGGMATGGLVAILMRYDSAGKQIYYGLAEEIRDRLTELGGAHGPPPDVWGSRDSDLIEYWKGWGVTQHRAEGGPDRWIDGEVRNRVVLDPEILKYLCNELIVESGVKLWLHSWVSSVIKEGETVKGVIIENKTGTQAVLGKIVIDATGDGDIMAWADAEFDKVDRSFAIPFRVGNVDVQKARDYIRNNREEYLSKMDDLKNQNGFWQERFFNTPIPNVVLFFNWYIGDALNVEHLTAGELEVKRKSMTTVNYYRENIPGFESCFLLDTAVQIGTRQSRMMVGEYVITGEDVKAKRKFDDVVAKGISYLDYNTFFDIPYRSLLPKKIENLIVTGRPISMDREAYVESKALIVQCFATGEAAGTAAAIALKEKVSPRNTDVTLIQQKLREQGVVL